MHGESEDFYNLLTIPKEYSRTTGTEDTMNGKIEKELRKIMKKKGFIIKTYVKDQIVYLEGEVASWDKVVEIGHLSGSIKGVKGVVNRITARKVEKVTRKDVTPVTGGTLPEATDVVIIGGGVIGCFIARELSRYDVDVILLEKEADVACGATKANNGQIHTGIGEKSGTLKRELCARAWPLYDKICKELDVPFTRNGLLVVMTEDTLKISSFITKFISKYVLTFLAVRRGKQVGDSPRVIKREELLKMEPHITERAVSAVLMPGYGVVCPYMLTIALAENAIQNGVSVFLETEVTNITVRDNRIGKIVTNRGEIKPRFVVNAAGVHADEMAAMAGAQEFTIHPRKGSILLFDKGTQRYITHQMGELKYPPDPHTKGGGLLETVSGNMLWGPSAVEVSDKEDTSVSYGEIEAMIEKYNPVLPDFSRNSIITYFAGVRASTYTEDFVIRPSKVEGFIHAAGIQSPGLTAAPVIAEIVVNLLKDAGLQLEKKDFNPVRKAPITFSKLSTEEKKKVINENPLYGNVICRCEHVTEGEVMAAIHSPLPAVTMDAIKRRTRAGMGRCQGGFCTPRVAEVLARELHIPVEEVTKKGRGSHLFVGRTKE